MNQVERNTRDKKENWYETLSSFTEGNEILKDRGNSKAPSLTSEQYHLGLELVEGIRKELKVPLKRQIIPLYKDPNLKKNERYNKKGKPSTNTEKCNIKKGIPSNSVIKEKVESDSVDWIEAKAVFIFGSSDDETEDEGKIEDILIKLTSTSETNLVQEIFREKKEELIEAAQAIQESRKELTIIYDIQISQRRRGSRRGSVAISNNTRKRRMPGRTPHTN